MAEATPVSQRPAVSVIVPARNEEACLDACLQSLAAQTGVNCEIVVVDDSSTDSTREIARSFPGVTLVDARPLPSGWSGKNNALVTGARQASGEWLLFTDADTVHLPGSLARALGEAIERRASLLSYSPAQAVESLSEKAVMPVIFAELAASYRPSQVSDPKSSAAAANGQYLLISREAYDAVGGHKAIATSLLEDVALARAVKRSGRRIFFRYGGDAVRTHMYRSYAQLKEGWTKNLVLLFPSPVRLALLRITEFLLIMCSTILAGVGLAEQRKQVAVLMAAAALCFYGLLIRRIRKAHFFWDANLLSVFGLPLFSYLLLRSKIAHREGAVTWKGRTYDRPQPEPMTGRRDIKGNDASNMKRAVSR